MRRDYKLDLADFINAPGNWSGYPVDAMHESLGHAKAVVVLLLSQFGEDVERTVPDSWVGSALDAVRGQLDILEKLIDAGGVIPPVKPAANE